MSTFEVLTTMAFAAFADAPVDVVVAEGVETAAQLAALGDFGCDYAQGFLLARPMPLEQLTALLRDQEGALWPGTAPVR